MTIGEDIARRRKDLGLSQSLFARRLGIPLETLKKYEGNKCYPCYGRVMLMATVLGADFEKYAGCRPTVDPIFGIRIKKLRITLGLSVAQLANKIGVPPTSIYGWESLIHQPSPRMVVRIEKFMNASLTTQLTLEECKLLFRGVTTGERIRRVRQMLGVSQVELGNRCGLFRRTIEEYERGIKIPSPKCLSVIADALDIDVNLLQAPPVHELIQEEVSLSG